MKSKSCKQRTEPLSAYSFYVKQEKQQIESKVRLNMTEVNLKWREMDTSQRKPFEKLAEEDKQSLGLKIVLERIRGK